MVIVEVVIRICVGKRWDRGNEGFKKRELLGDIGYEGKGKGKLKMKRIKDVINN